MCQRWTRSSNHVDLLQKMIEVSHAHPKLDGLKMCEDSQLFDDRQVKEAPD